MGPSAAGRASWVAVLVLASCSGAPTHGWKSFAGGGSHTVAIKTDGTLWAWGSNFYGQLGDGTTADERSPIQIGTATDWRGVAAGDWHTVAIKTGGALWAWGYNYSGQLGNGRSGFMHDRLSPVLVP